MSTIPQPNPQETPMDSDAVLSMQEMESEEQDVQAHLCSMSATSVMMCSQA